MGRDGSLLVLALAAAATPALGQTIGFDDQRAGEAAKGFSCALTGSGTPGVWRLVRDAGAPSPSLVLAQTDADATRYRLPHCVLESVHARDVELRVRFKPVSGEVDRAAGLVWRYRDPDNYYVLRANALENNVVMYKVEKGRRLDLPLKGLGRSYGMKADVPAGSWSELALVARGELFEAHLNGRKLYEVEDATFRDAGRVGLWTKADSLTYFDDLKIVVR